MPKVSLGPRGSCCVKSLSSETETAAIAKTNRSNLTASLRHESHFFSSSFSFMLLNVSRRRDGLLGTGIEWEEGRGE